MNAIETSGLLIQAAAAPAILLAIHSDSVTRFVLGPGWAQSGELLRWLVIPASLFAATNFSDRLFDMLRRQGVLLTLEAAAASLTLFAAALVSVTSKSINHLAIALAFISTLYSVGQFVTLGVICRAKRILIVKPIVIFTLIAGLIITIDHIGRTMFATSILGVAAAVLSTTVISRRMIRLWLINRA